MRKKIFCRRKYLRLPACELDQQLERFAHRDIVVYDKDDRLLLRLNCWRHSNSTHSKRCIKRVQKIVRLKWLEQTLDCALRDQTWPHCRFALGRDKDDGDRLLAKF